MLLRRWLLGSPLALLVALLAHAAGFGSSHALAGGHGALLLWLLAASLAGTALSAAVSVAGWVKSGLGREACLERLRAMLPGPGGWIAGTGMLGASGLAMLAGIEAVEGRGVPLWMLGPILACGLVVALLSYFASNGLVSAVFAMHALPAGNFAPRFQITRPALVLAVRSHEAAGTRRGRAPPLSA